MDPEWGFHMENHGGYVKETTGRLFLFPLAVSNSPDADPKVLGD